jgi:hypothetical protein
MCTFGASAISRRSLLAGAVAFPAAATLGNPSKNRRARLVLLGTSGGPALIADGSRAGIASALVVGDAEYVVDCGYGTADRG